MGHKLEINRKVWPPILTLIMILWASFYPITKFMVNDIDPLVLSFYRYLLGTLPLTPIFLLDLKKKNKLPDYKDLLYLTLLGFLGITIFSVFLFYGIKLATAVNGALLANTQTIFAALLGPVLIGEIISGRKKIAVVLGFAGMILVVSNGHLSGFSTENTAFWGNLLLTGASAALTIYTILIKKFVIKYGGIVPTWITMISGTICILFINLIRGKSPDQLLLLPPLSIGMVFYLGIFATALPYFVFNKALIHMPVVSATSFKLLIPVFGLLFSSLFLGERPGAATIAGIIIVLISIYLIQTSPEKIS